MHSQLSVTTSQERKMEVRPHVIHNLGLRRTRTRKLLSPSALRCACGIASVSFGPLGAWS
jgi:hypothetical protein